jgi:hypothetical protein
LIFASGLSFSIVLQGELGTGSMVDPVGITLGAVALLFPIYDACDRIYHGYQLTRSYSDDFALVQLELEFEYCCFNVTAQRRVIDLEKPIDINDPENENTKTVIKALSNIKRQFALANVLMEKYAKQGKYTIFSLSIFVCILSECGYTYIPRLMNQIEEQADLARNNDAVHSSATSITAPNSSNATTTEPKKPFYRRMKEKLKNLGSRTSPQTSATTTKTSSNATLTTGAGQTLLESPAVANANRAESLAARDHSRDTSFYRKVIWAKEDMDHLKKIIKAIKRSNRFLSETLACKPTQDATRMVHTADRPDTRQIWQGSARLTQQALLRLHTSLRTMNRTCKSHEPWKLSIQLSTNFADNESGAINALYGFERLRQNSTYFFLQRHMHKNPEQTSFFVAETINSPPNTETNNLTNPLIDEASWELDQPIALAQSPQVGAYRDWGVVYPSPNFTDVHRLYHAEAQVSQRFGALPDLLTDENMSKFTRRQRVELAHLIAISYFHFRQVTPLCSDIHPTSFCYYANPEEGKVWIKDNPLIMRPYLSIGFGEAPPPVVLGGNTGVSSSQSAIIVGLGLLLFQVGCCLKMIYPPQSTAFAEAQRFASFNLHRLDTKVSGVYAELTHACLQYPLTTAPNDPEAANAFLESVVSKLQTLQASIF